jgi:hypothetical protein
MTSTINPNLIRNADATPAPELKTVFGQAKADIEALQTAVAGKAGTSHSHVISDVTSLQTALNAKLTATVAANQLDSVAENTAGIVSDFNDLLASLKAAGIMAADPENI